MIDGEREGWMACGKNSYARFRAELGAVGPTLAQHIHELYLQTPEDMDYSISQSIVWHVHVSLCLETAKAYPKKRWHLHNTILYIWWVISLRST